MNLVSSPWHVVFGLGFLVYLRIRGVYAHRTRNEARVFRQIDLGEKLLLALVMVGSLLLPVLFLFTPWLAVADYQLPTWVPWCGTVVMLLALWLFWRSHADLGRLWSISLEISAAHQLVEHGVYRRVRHPMYTAIFLWSIAQGLLLANWLAGWGAFATFAVMYVIRTPREEAMLCEHLGQPYRDYMARTGRDCGRDCSAATSASHALVGLI